MTINRTQMMSCISQCLARTKPLEWMQAKEGGQADADFSAVFSAVLQQVKHNKSNLENSH